MRSLNPQSTIHNPQSAIAIDVICRFGPNEGEANAILNLQSGSDNPQSTIRNPQLSVRPLLKWAGGKRQLLPVFRRFYPREFGAYFEPFVGSGAVFFDLHAARALDGRRVVLTDSNRDLVGCYRTVRDDPAGVVAALERLARGHATEGERHYYAVRDQFNDQRRQLPARTMAYTPALAAMLIYLNRTGFNGLFRLNGDGRFNVPVGPLHAPADCRSRSHLRHLAHPLAAGRLDRAGGVRRRAEESATSRLSLFRPAVRAAVGDGAVHRVYRVGILACRPRAAARCRGDVGRSRVPRDGEQLERPGRRQPVRGRPDNRGRGIAALPAAGAPCDQLAIRRPRRDNRAPADQSRAPSLTAVRRTSTGLADHGSHTDQTCHRSRGHSRISSVTELGGQTRISYGRVTRPSKPDPLRRGTKLLGVALASQAWVAWTLKTQPHPGVAAALAFY